MNCFGLRNSTIKKKIRNKDILILADIVVENQVGYYERMAKDAIAEIG